MRNGVLTLAAWVPLPVMALDLEAISRGLVEAGPWGKNADMLPYLLGWLGFILLLAVLLKLVYTEYDRWRTSRRANQAARQNADNWVLEVGKLLNVPAPGKLKPGSTPGMWHQYRHQVKRALMTELRRNREMAAELDELRP